MELNNTKEKLISSLKSSRTKMLKFNHYIPLIYRKSFIKAVEKLNLPDLPENQEYAFGFNKNAPIKNILISKTVFWDDNLNCWNYKDIKRICEIKI